MLRVSDLVKKHTVIVSTADGCDQQAHVVRRIDAKAGGTRILKGTRLCVYVYVLLPLDANAEAAHRSRVCRKQVGGGKERIETRHALKEEEVCMLKIIERNFRQVARHS